MHVSTYVCESARAPHSLRAALFAVPRESALFPVTITLSVVKKLKEPPRHRCKGRVGDAAPEHALLSKAVG